jgi:CBS domain-containing protein
MKVESVMGKRVEKCGSDQTLNDAARIMWERDCGIVPIVGGNGDDHVLGVITDRDICIAAYMKGRPLSEISIGEVMSKKVMSCRASDEVGTAERTMQQAQVHRLPVVDESGRLVGVLALADIARASARGATDKEPVIELGQTVAAIRRPRGMEARPGP